MQDFSVYDDVPLGVCILLKSRKVLNILYCNQSFAIMSGVTGATAAKMTGHPFSSVWPDREASLLEKKLKSTTAAETFLLPVVLRNQNKGWISFSILEANLDGKDVYMLWGTDISDSKAHEQELLAEVQKADAIAEMKSNFLATMSHEIRTPMQTIYGILELIADEKPEAKIAQMITTAQGAASGLLEILDDVLDLAKMDANKMELDVYEVPVRTLVRGILEALSVKVHGKDVKLRDEIEDDVPFVVIGDPKRLRQIIMNLTGNALKFTDKGTVTVRVSRKIKNINVPAKYVGLRFEIIDTGMGMSQDVCDKLFQSFVQADNTTARKHGGTGLGLSICKKLTELMGGRIGVTSEIGKGSNFWFEIPTEEVNVNTTTVQLPKLDGISVLSVEDHPQGAKEIVNSLRSMGATADSCPTYREALDLIQRRPFDVAIIDQGLPDGLGLDLIKRIMDIRPYMGMIMYTVRDDAGLQHSLQALGVTYLSKPAGRAGLGEAVKNAASKGLNFKIDGPTKLLIAEDTESVRDILRRQLEKIGVEADFAHNGQEALKAVNTGKYGILITDLHMPEIDGYQLVEKIRENERAKGANAHFPVIVLTADVQMAQRDTYLRYGFNECLLKPVSLGQFKRLLVRWGLVAQAENDFFAHSTEQKNEISAVDTKAIVDMMGAFDENAIEMLGMFIDMTKPLIAKIEKTQKSGDFHGLHEAAHSLKGAARSACCTILGDLAAKLQDDAGKNIPSENLVTAIVEEFARAEKEIRSMKTS